MATTRIRKGLSYVIGESADNENHILPINAMQYSRAHQQLITGGRDGVIKVWSNDNDDNRDKLIDNGANGGTLTPNTQTDLDTTNSDTSERLLKLETSISSRPLGYQPINNNYRVVQNYNLHFDWINDLQLINNDSALVTCSSDLSLKLIDLNDECHKDNKIHKFSNVHTDYVKKLSFLKNHQKNIVSGGLDGKVVLWDLNMLTPDRIIENISNNVITNSIYSLANDGSNLISCGGPNNTINIFDKRQEMPFIKKLIGHQDNVRCLLMNDEYILSGSSDSTIKLWDLRNYQILKNFDFHDDPVWSITADPSNFKTFYSADRAGNIVKTDMNYYGVLKNENPSADFITDKIGLSTLVAKCDTPVMGLCIESDNSGNDVSLFSSTDMALSRYHIPKTQDLAHYQYLRMTQEVGSQLFNDEHNDDTNMDSDLNSDIYDLVSHLSMDTNYDLQSNMSAPNNAGLDDFDTSEYVSMFLDSNGGGPSMEFVNIDDSTQHKSNFYINNLPVGILLNPIRPDQITPIPFNKEPLHKYPLTPKSIIAKRLFNNKRSMLVLYLNGEISIWDIFICRKVQTFGYHDDKAEITSEMIKQRLKDMDDIFHEYQTTDTLNNWCDVEIKSGKLLITMGETSFNNVEIYYDELSKNYPFLKMELDEEAQKNPKVEITGDDRLQLSRILLNSMFHQYTLFEWEFDKDLREKLKHSKKSGDGGGVNITKESFSRMKMFSRKSSSSHLQTLPQTGSNKTSNNNSQTNSNNASIVDFPVDGDPISEFIHTPQVDQYEDSINYLLQDNKAKYIEKAQQSRYKTPETCLKIYSNSSELNRNHLTGEDSVLFKPLINLNELPQDLLIIIFENSPQLGNLRDVFSFRLSELKNLDPKSRDNMGFVNDLRRYLPKWIGQPILYDRFPIKESPKIAFQLLELDYTTLPPEKKINGKSQRKIKRLPVLESSIKLTSHNMLRVSKILSYLTEKFDSRTSEMKEKLPPTAWLVLECRGQELLPSMTLQTIKSKIWKSSLDIELRFRRKFDK